MQDKQVPVDRKTLYKEVWADPVKVVAERYRLSDVGLAKICKKLSIPIPSRGYWAKVKAGKIMRKIPLPALPPSALALTGPKPLSKRQRAARVAVQDSIAMVKEHQPVIDVPTELSDPHPLVRAAEKRLKQRDGWEGVAGLRSAPSEVLHLEVTGGSLQRALCLVDTLLKSLEALGMTVSVDSKAGKTVLDSAGTKAPLAITEKISRRPHTKTRTEERALTRYSNSWRTGERVEYPTIPQFDHEATGRLTITVGRWPSRNWNDTTNTSLDDRMSEVVSGVLVLMERLRAEAAERARADEVRRLAWAKYQRQVEHRTAERRKLGELQRQAARFRRATQIRDYISALEDRARYAGDLSPDLVQWIVWARAKADWIDPLVQVSDVILDAPEPERPGYW